MIRCDGAPGGAGAGASTTGAAVATVPGAGASVRAVARGADVASGGGAWAGGSMVTVGEDGSGRGAQLHVARRPMVRTHAERTRGAYTHGHPRLHDRDGLIERLHQLE